MEGSRVNYLAFLFCCLTSHDDSRDWSSPTTLRVRCESCGRVSAGVPLAPFKRRTVARKVKRRPATIYAIEGKRGRREGSGGD